MKLKQYDIVVLLSSLVVFSFGIGIWHNHKMPAMMGRGPLSLALDIAQTSENVLDTMSNDEIITFFRPLALSRSVEKIARTFKGISVERAVSLVELLCNDQSLKLHRLDKKELIMAVAFLFDNEKDQEKVLNIYVRSPELHKGRPLPIIVLQDYYQKYFPALLAWIEKQKNVVPTPTPIKTVEADSYSYALDHNEIAQFALMVKRGLPLDAQLATDLLWQLVDHKKNAALIPLLVAAGADVNNVRNKRTPLINAVANNNKEVVVALLKAGADVNKVADKTVGSALQQSFGKGSTDIELILRSHGARE